MKAIIITITLGLVAVLGIARPAQAGLTAQELFNYCDLKNQNGPKGSQELWAICIGYLDGVFDTMQAFEVWEDKKFMCINDNNIRRNEAPGLYRQQWRTMKAKQGLSDNFPAAAAVFTMFSEVFPCR